MDKKISVPFEWIYRISEDISGDATYKKKWEFNNSNGTLVARLQSDNVIFEWIRPDKKNKPIHSMNDEWSDEDD